MAHSTGPIVAGKEAYASSLAENLQHRDARSFKGKLSVLVETAISIQFSQ